MGRFVPAGAVLEILVLEAPMLAGQWRDHHMTPFPVVSDAPNAFAPDYYDAASAPMNMFVDVETMTMLSIEVGFDREGAEAIIETWLQ